jgi:hypothetical protein
MKKTFIKKGILACFAAIVGIASSFAQTITTGAVDASVCAGSAISVPFTTTGTFAAGTVFSAELSDATGTFAATPLVIGTATASPVSGIIPAASAAGTAYKIRVTTPATVGSLSTNISINVTPPAPTVTSPVNYTVGDPATALPTSAGYMWYTSATGGSGSGIPPTPSTATAGTTSYFVGQQSGNCIGPRSEIKVIVTAAACTPPAAPAVTTPVNVTVGQAATLTATAISGATLNWYGTSATGGTSSNTAPTVSTAAVGSTTYYVSQSVGSCESPRSAIVVNVAAACTTPAAPAVTTPVNVTVGQAATLTATAISGATLNWYGTNATGGTSSPTAPTVSTAAVGSTTYYVSQSVGTCESPRSAIVVNVAAACTTPAAPAVTTPVNVTVGQAATLTATAISGATLNWYGTNATGGTSSPTAPTVSTATVGSTTYYVSQSVGSCESPRSAIVVNVAAACTTPAAPAVTTPVNVTVGQAATLTATAITGASLNWYGTSATGGTSSATAPTVSTATVGSTTYYVSQSVGSCESPRSAIVVNVTAPACTTPAAPAVTTPVNVTVGQAATLSATAITGATLNWYGTNATGGTASATAPTVSTATAGSTTYYVSQSVGTCESPRSAIVVNVTAPACTTPAAPAVTTPVNVTVGQAATLTATAISGATLNWYGTSATGGTASATAPTVSTATAGSTTYYVSQSVGTCESPRAAIVVNVAAAACTTPAAPIVQTPLNYTVGQTAALTATALTGATLNWYGTSATGGTPTATAPAVSTAAVGSTTYYVSQSVGTCESPRSAIVVNVTAAACTAPAAPVVITPLNVTVGQAATLTATAISGATLKWYGTNATGGTSTSTAPVVSTAAVGSTTYYVSQIVGTCESPRSAIVVNVTVAVCATPAPTVISSVTYCLNEVPAALTATGTGLRWYTVPTGGTVLATVPIPSTATAGTVPYYVSQTLNGCEGPRAKIDVIVNPATPAPTVVASVPYCIGETALALTATGTALKWYTTATIATGNTIAPVPLTTTAGTTSYYVTQTLNGCESTRTKIDVIVNPAPLAPTIPASLTTTYCFNGTGTALTATGTALKWYTAATGGPGATAAPVPSTTTAGITSYFVSQSLNGCESVRTEIKITVKPQLPAPTVASATLEYCQFFAAPALTATPMSGSVLSWYNAPTGGTAAATAPVPSTATAGTISYYVSQTDVTGCVSARAKVDVKTNVTEKPSVATPAVAYCQNEAATPLVATGTNLKWYLTLDDTNPRANALIPFTEKVADYSFYVTQTGTNTCESAKAEIKVHIKPLPSATISGNTSIGLGGTATIKIDFTGDGPWTYILSNGSTATTSSSSVQVPVSPSVTTSYVVTEVSNACGKGIINGIAIVTVQVPTLTIGVPSVSLLCAGKTFTVPFQQSGSFPEGSSMKAQISTVNETARFISIPSVINGNVVTATIPDTIVKGTYYIRIANISKEGTVLAAGNVSTGQITVNPLPVATISGATTIYMGATANLKVDLTGDAPWTFSVYNGTRDSLVSTSVNPITVRVTPKTTTTYTITAVSNQCGAGRGAGSARIQVDPVLGTEPPVVSADWLKIYPTLVEAKCTVEITTPVSAKEAVFEILDLNGRSLFKKSIHQKITEVDFSQRPAGLYLLKVQNGKNSSVQRILKP